ncbi:type 2 lantibiotic biosynthesis protein LanM [Mycobacterium tuberculosis]|nr:type 2 lantibiotic biosynthesis protein LanM [Mycobacterium tuberculosis]
MTTTEFHRAAGAALAAASVSDGYRLSWFGETVDTIRPLPDDAMMAEAAASFLSRLLYRGFYLFGWPRKDQSAFRESMMEGLPASRSARFINAAVFSGGDIGPSTVVRPLEEFQGLPATEFDGVKVQVKLDRRQSGTSTNLVHVKRPGVSLTKSPGFMLFRSPHGQPSFDGQSLIRLYWNVTAVGALDLVALLSRTLAERDLRYEFKVVHSDGEWPERADTGVLYIGHRDLLNTWPALREIHGRLLPYMRPYVPALTRRLGVGLSVAEDPGDGASHGMFVCEAIAEGLVRAHHEGFTDPARQMAHVAEWFASKGRSLEAPYASEEVAYTTVEALSDTSPPQAKAAMPPTMEPLSDDVLLGHVDRLARRISGDALWHDDRCTWLKPQPDGNGRRAWVPMAADLYTGTAGMGMFFAQLATVTGDRSHARLALAACRQALATADELPGIGLYSGASGVGLAVAVAGHALGEEALAADGCALVDRTADRILATGGPVPFDMVDGVAGALVTVLGAQTLGSTGGLTLAGPLGTLLMDLGTGGRPGELFWLDRGRGDTMGFIGFAHGVAGCALALAELGHALREPLFLDAADRACRYERRWLDDTTGQWRDVRSIQERGPDANTDLEPDVHRYDWCYGAPGIALSRTGPLLDEGRATSGVTADARAGFRAAERAGETFPTLVHHACLCHGAAGIAEILSLTPAEFADGSHSRIARALTLRALVSHHDALVWPDGYGVMLGAAGAALTALRRVDPTIVSPLLPLPHRFGRAEPG